MDSPTLRHSWTRRLGAFALFLAAVWVCFTLPTGVFVLDVVLGIGLLFLALRLGTITAACPSCGKRLFIVKGDASKLHCLKCGASMAGGR